jgi:hypothetical protein
MLWEFSVYLRKACWLLTSVDDCWKKVRGSGLRLGYLVVARAIVGVSAVLQSRLLLSGWVTTTMSTT